MTDKLKEYERFFRLQRRDQEKKYERYANTPLKALFSEGKAFYGNVVGTTDNGQLVLRFNCIFTPRLKVPMVICLLRQNAFKEFGSSIQNWECTSIKFRENERTHTSFSDVLPIYYMSNRKTMGCGKIVEDMLRTIKQALEKHKELCFVMLEALPPTELLKNLADYITIHPEDENLVLHPNKTYDDWRPVELTSDENVGAKVCEALEKEDVCVLQGPPGTGKSYTLGAIISKVTEENKMVCVTTQSNASLISLVSQETMKPLINRGVIRKTVLTAEEKKKHPFLASADKNLRIEEGGLMCSTYYSLSKIINTVDAPVYDLIIIEEASQAFLTAISAFMKLGKKCIIVGDPMQLPPVVEMINEEDYKSIDVDTQANGMMTYVCSKEVPSFRITTSYRLTEASTNQTKFFYGGHFTSVQKTRTTFNVSPEMAPFFPKEGGTIVYNTVGDSSANCSKGALDIIEKIVSVFTDYYPKRRLAILSPFVLTTNKLQEAFCGEGQKLDLLVETINRIQGETVDYTIYYVPLRNHRFAFSDNLFNVATSRSRSTTLLVTDMPLDAIHIGSIKVLEFVKNCKQVDVNSFSAINRDEIKKNYPKLEALVDELLDNRIEFSYDGDVDLVLPNGEIAATAGLLLDKYKLAIDPVDEESRMVFEREGYRVVSSNFFSISMIK